MIKKLNLHLAGPISIHRKVRKLYIFKTVTNTLISKLTKIENGFTSKVVNVISVFLLNVYLIIIYSHTKKMFCMKPVGREAVKSNIIHYIVMIST